MVLPLAACCGVCSFMPMHRRPVFGSVTFGLFLLIGGFFAYRDFLRLAPWGERYQQPWTKALPFVDPILVAGLIGGVLLAAGTVRLSFVVRPPVKRATSKAAFGDADVMTMQEAGRLFPPDSGIVVGERYRVDRDVVHAIPFNPRDRSTWGKGGTPPLLTFDGSFGGSHCLIFAGSGGFKTTGSVIPTALTWAGPIVCFDPSTEIVPLVRGHRRDGLGRTVHILDPAHPLGFDVTDWIKTSRKKEQDIATLALWLLAESPRARTGADIYFHNQAHNLLTGLLTHVLLAPEYAGERNLRGLRKLIATPKKTRACRKVFGVYPALSLRAAYAPPNRRWPMILSAIAEKLKRRSKDDFKGRHFEATLIVQAVSWYLRYPLSYRDIEELFLERGLEVDHSTLNRWVLAYAPLIEKRLRAFRKPHCGSVRIDETYIKVRGQWRYLYRAIDKHGNPVDFLLTAKRDLDAAQRFFRKALQDQPLLSPDRIGIDGAGSYPPAIAESRKAGLLARTPVHYVTKHLQQGTCSRGSRAITFGSSGPCHGSGAFRPSTRRGAPSRASKPCWGCARGSALRAPGRCASRTGCSRSASVFQRLIKCKTGANPARPTAYA